ncbi:hypothetical protein [Oceanobacter mangrovi]|uniref:hypothetical protein n=1 Tax=Oceanobacter mangrovi TaxID=2862510 RepID=UPI001C8E4948|nr:hypothetical protein [Oceanobacter mangrovi]
MDLQSEYQKDSQHIKKLILTILIMCFISPLSHAKEKLNLAVDDSQVYQDKSYPGCDWDHCLKKAKKIEKNYLKKRILKEFNGDKSFTINEIDPDKIKNGLKITISLSMTASGRGYAEFTTGLITMGTAPLKQKGTFKITYEIYKGGIIAESRSKEFTENRNISVLLDIQEYKKKAAGRIYKSGKAFWKDFKKK